MSVRVPKTFRWEDLRQIIGDRRTEDLITATFGPTLLGPRAIKVQRVGVEHMLAFMTGNKVEGMKSGFYQAIPAVFRKYYQESPAAKGRFIKWLRRQLEEMEGESHEDGIEEGASQMAADVKKAKPRRRLAPHTRVRNGKEVKVNSR